MIVGKLLLPCDLSVKMSMKNGDEEEIVRKEIEEEGFVSENEIHTFVSCTELEKVREETEVSVWIVFGKADSPSSTEPYILKNRSESVGKGDERIVEGGKEEKSSWAVFYSSFVRTESLCLTTSSMSNLVDAMDCSSPHEKLIVDLRDSLFMLLHGLNKTKEMAIGTLQEREQTAAQILFWVANLALHSFDEMENPLQSLSNLSPHIVLFSEHMVICIVMHSDFSSDSDSSSTSSSTVVTSASDDDDDDDDSLPSSAFEDDEYNRKECLRWMAPELLMNKKMGATKESVVFSIGMMLWECLTLQIPFGEYEGEVAGQKIVNGERPGMGEAEQSSYLGLVKKCVSQDWRERGSLTELKREFIQRFPAGSLIMTMTDALCCYSADGNKREPSCGSGNGNGEGTEGSSRIVLLVQ
ncbi:uncharacterized protein MONOS_12746 [Monocercomonoides exilis]|uniref:uncharacterized protein n=1 Tax=Monocercomonoides exilis TaxID=2049356 RepID=UPI00355AC990|nr:hypothetical protein MONOS_12746 [Monocercomonoides exilis]|eukprot:MONOS_12746.1-p1 / transcript=MONOS_12746.1 / gene=MONOS_12746 / organism=Monocercomonoides_exilis_PA203 / gene_product=unspecified product / transcript_product=unspecified product / location=Mono_scaffold00728:7301-8655(+) / protein_length=411 / sequence_SO=supercontig / SO=protein_coding / is_pseudo=false